MLRLLSSLVAALFLSGCFILDEFDKGDALIEQHSVGWREKKKQKAEAKEAAKEEESKAAASSDSDYSWSAVKQKFQEVWQEALEEEAVPPDPSDVVIRCELRGQVRFTRKSNCATLKGRAMEISSNQK